MGVPTYRVPPCDEGHTLHWIGRGETPPVGPRSRAETGVAWYGSEVVCGCVVWSAQRWEVSYGFMRGTRRSRSSALYILIAGHRGEIVAASNSANQGLHSRQFLIAQGYKIGPVIMYQDNLSSRQCLLEVGLVRSAQVI
jgi:hypothetical protein